MSETGESEIRSAISRLRIAARGRSLTRACAGALAELLDVRGLGQCCDVSAGQFAETEDDPAETLQTRRRRGCSGSRACSITSRDRFPERRLRSRSRGVSSSSSVCLPMPRGGLLMTRCSAIESFGFKRQLEIRDDVAHFHALVKRKAADDVVGQAGAAHRFFKHTRLRICAIQDCRAQVVFVLAMLENLAGDKTRF